MQEDAYPLLNELVDPLQAITNKFMERIKTIIDFVEEISQKDDIWQLRGKDDKIYKAYNVVLALGGFTKTLDYKTPPSIPLTIALDSEQLK